MSGLPSPDVCAQLFYAALKARDWQGVEAALRIMAPQDPHRAEQLLEVLRLGVELTAAGEDAPPTRNGEPQ